jgi:RNA polymerase sigma factor (sigma-70 family)
MPLSPRPEPSSQPDELAVVYPRLNPPLRRIVARNVTAPGAVIEEACQFAWSRWLDHRREIVPAATLGWLATTATRETLRLLRAQAHEISLDALGEQDRVLALPERTPSPDQIVTFREQLAEIHQLPIRQQRMVWLHGLGFDYGEIAERTGDSRRTVERQLLRAKRTLRSVS